MQTYTHTYFAEFGFEWDMLRENAVQKIKTHFSFWTKSSLCVLILYIHFINIYFRQHSYIIKAWVKAKGHVST